MSVESPVVVLAEQGPPSVLQLETVDIADPVASLFHLFQGEGLDCADGADANDDGTVDISDPVTTLEYLFLGEAPLPPPGAGVCAFDPTPDSLRCASGCRP